MTMHYVEWQQRHVSDNLQVCTAQAILPMQWLSTLIDVQAGNCESLPNGRQFHRRLQSRVCGRDFEAINVTPG